MSEVTASKLLPTQEIFKIAPEVVANVDIVMTLVPLQLEALNVPAIDYGGYLRVCIVDIVATDACEELPLCISVLPLSELPVLAIDKDSDYSCPA